MTNSKSCGIQGLHVHNIEKSSQGNADVISDNSQGETVTEFDL